MADRPTARRCRICRAPEHGRHKMSCDYARYPSRFPDGPVYVDVPVPTAQPIQGAGYTPAQMIGADTDRPTPRLDVLIDRACRHLTPAEGRALRGGVARLRNEGQRLEERLRDFTDGAADREAILTEARDALEDAGAGGHGDDWPHLAPGIRALQDRAERAEQQAANVRAVLAEVLAQFTHNTHPGWPCKQTGHVNVATVQRWHAALDTAGQPDTEEAGR
ncbi:MAG TPA: hypothetical protein VFG74_12745 [Miltoncostaeaceae bacterium]|nr:hypothetical protein [Miltoncostaeaceae bacterium]